MTYDRTQKTRGGPSARPAPLITADEITAAERVLAAVEHAARAQLLTGTPTPGVIGQAADTLRRAFDRHGPWLIERSHLAVHSGQNRDPEGT